MGWTARAPPRASRISQRRTGVICSRRSRPIGKASAHTPRWRDGRRMSEADLRNVVGYYASLRPSRPRRGASPSAILPYEKARAIASACARCHGEDGKSEDPRYAEPRRPAAALSGCCGPGIPQGGAQDGPDAFACCAAEQAGSGKYRALSSRRRPPRNALRRLSGTRRQVSRSRRCAAAATAPAASARTPRPPILLARIRGTW